MGQPGAVIVAFMLHKDLGLVFEAAKGAGMDNAITVAAVAAARGAFGLGIKAPPAGPRPRGIAGMRPRRADNRAQQPARGRFLRRIRGVGFGHAEDYIETAPRTARASLRNELWSACP